MYTLNKRRLTQRGYYQKMSSPSEITLLQDCLRNEQLYNVQLTSAIWQIII